MKFKIGDRVSLTHDDGTRYMGIVTIVDERGHPPWVATEVPNEPQIYIKWDDGEEDVYFEEEFEDLDVISK